MLDGPKVGLIVLAIALAVVGLSIYVYERRTTRRRYDLEPKRLPLFGTGQLAIRSADGDDVYEDAPPDPRPVVRPRVEEPRLPPAPHPVSTSGNGRPARPPSVPAPAPRDSFRPPPAPAPGPMVSRPTAEHPRPGVGATASARAVAPPAPVVPSSNGLPDLAMVEGETLRFSVPSDGTVEFVPGRLEIVAGPESGREIRFGRTPGESVVEVTFGRSEGPPNRHVQILARTVSRRHALMSLIDEHWQLTNLSATNPVVLNGRVLADNEVAPLLVEGDRIEMGEVAFVFHED